MSNLPDASSDPSQAQNVRVQIAPGDVVAMFHDLYYNLGATGRATWTQTFWMGVPTEKYPSDLWVYQELIHHLQPQLIIETGTRHGGSAFYFSHMLDIIGQGEVVTIDIRLPMQPPTHPRLTYLTGSSTDPTIVQQVRELAAGKSSVMVILDSDHSMEHVIAEMRAYHSLVTPGSYLVVEDTNVNGHPVHPQHGPGPMEALNLFMLENHDFEIDPRCEKFLVTANPSGFLRRRRG